MKTVEELQKELDAKDKEISDLKTAQSAKDEEVTKIKAKLDELLTETKQAKQAKKEAEEKAAAEAAALAAKNGDVDALNKSWQAKLDKQAEEFKTQLDANSSQINKLLVDNVAVTIATELALPGSSDVLLPHVKGRLKTELRDGQLVTVVTDKDGKPSASTIDDLKNEIRGNAVFAPVIVASQGSGSGAHQNKGGGAAQKTIKRADWDTKSDHERSALAKEGVTVTD